MVASIVRALRAAIAIFFHTALAALIVTLIHYFQYYLNYLENGKDVLVFDKVPLRYLFQIIDVGVIIALGYNAIREVMQAYRGEE